jgi:hypothetical protein
MLMAMGSPRVIMHRKKKDRRTGYLASITSRARTRAVSPRHHETVYTCTLIHRSSVARLANMARNIKFYINDTVIENVTEFKYLGRIISAEKLPKRGTACTEFSVGIQLIVVLWHDFIWLSFKPNYYMALKHGSYPNVPSRDLNHFITDVLVL